MLCTTGDYVIVRVAGVARLWLHAKVVFTVT
jgi:hypothetical protein